MDRPELLNMLHQVIDHKVPLTLPEQEQVITAFLALDDKFQRIRSCR